MTTLNWLKIGFVLWFESSWFKKYITDGWITTGPQIATPSNLIRVFVCCNQCGRTLPGWVVMMSPAEVKARGFIGCKCGSMYLRPSRISAFKSFYWFAVRGWLIRKILLNRNNWDPRIVGMSKDLA